MLDLLDTRHGRKWLGTAPAVDRRGVLGDLLGSVDTLIDRRPLTATPRPDTVYDACRLLARHRLWIGEQDWAADLHADLQRINRALLNAVGEHRRPPVGRCHLTDPDTGKPCGGPLLVSRYGGGVHCGRCRNTWDTSQLRILGLALGGRPVNPHDLPRYTWDQAEVLGLATARGFQAFGIPAATVRSWAAAGKVTAVGKAPGGAHLYPMGDVLAVAHRVPGTTT